MKPGDDVQREAAILATLTYPIFETRLKTMLAEGQSVQHQELAREVLQEVSGELPVPRRVIDSLSRAYGAQRRFENPRARFSKKRFVLQGSFPVALFVRELALRARGQNTDELKRWAKLRQQFLAEVKKTETKDETTSETTNDKKPAKKRRRRRRRKLSSPAPAARTED
jgi:hypothetical protein